MRLIIFLFYIVFFFNNAKGQERVYKIHETIVSNNIGSFSRPIGYLMQSADRPSDSPIRMSGNFNPNGASFLVYTVQDIDSKFKNILDSLAQYKVNYNLNRETDFNNLKIYFLEIQKNIKKSIDSIPQIVTATDVAKLLKVQIIKDLKETEIENLKNEINSLKEAIDLLKIEITELKKKKSN